MPPPMMPPPPGMMLPPPGQQLIPGQPPIRPGAPVGSSVFSAPPSIIEKTPSITIKHQPTIQAKPQINTALKVASTKFVPTALKVKREGTGHKLRTASEIAEAAAASAKVADSKIGTGKVQTASKDEIYQQFLAEVSELL